MNPPSKPTPPTVWHRLDHFLARLRPHREPLSLVVDGLLIAFAWNVTYLFRIGFDRWFDARPWYDFWVMLGIIAAYLTLFWILRVPQSMWRFSGFGEVKRLTWACLGAGVACAATVMGLQLYGVPRSVLALHPLVTLMSVCMVRVGYRMLYEHSRAQITGGDKEVRRALILGAGQAAKRLMAGIHQQGWIVMGMLDDDPAKQGARIAGVPVLGPLEAVSDRAVLGAATHLVIALPGATARQRRRAFELASSAGLPVLTVPSADELRLGTGSAERVRDIEPEDLLGRESVQLDEQGIDKVLHGKTVLITGGGGSIGAELCRQVARYKPARLVLVELSEFNLYTIEQELSPALSRVAAAAPGRRREGPGQPAQHPARHAPGRRLPCRGLQARAVDGGAQRVGGDAQQHAGQLQRGARVCRGRRRALCPHQHRQGRQPDQRDGRDQAGGGDRDLGARAEVAGHALHGGALRQRAGLVGQRDPEVQGADRARRPDHHHPPRHHPLLHDDPRGRAPGAAGGRDRHERPGAGAGHGRAGAHRRSGAAADPLSGHAPEDIPIVFSGLRPGEKLFEEMLADSDTTIATPIARLRIARLRERNADDESVDAWLTAFDALRYAEDEAIRTHLRRLVPEFQPPIH